MVFGMTLRALAVMALGAAAVVLAGCDPAPGGAAPTGAAKPPSANAFRVLASSEVKDLEPAFIAAAKATGVEVSIAYAGTLDLVERLNAGESFDATLPSNSSYPSLALTTKPLAREKLFYSRVALGVKTAKARSLGWDKKPPTWKDIAAAAKAGTFTYGMTNPTASNTGMSALFAVASAGAGKTEDLSVQEIDQSLLKDFLSGQKMTAGSSGWLADAYVKDPKAIDGMVNYEAVLLRVNEKVADADKMLVITPQDGSISADYPIMLLNGAKRDDFNKLVAAFKGADFQSGAVKSAFLRPSNGQAGVSPALSAAAVAELSFPNNLDVIDGVLSAYLGEWRRPSTSIFVLDVSGSMKGKRFEDMKSALRVLAGVQATSASARYAAFQKRERVAMITFSDDLAPPVWFEVNENRSEVLGQVASFVDAMTLRGGTAIYSALDAAQALAEQEMVTHPDRFISIVLLTDGENGLGMNRQAFDVRFASGKPVRIFPIIFGDANDREMKSLAEMSGGRVFDARKGQLSMVFKEIRGYQ